MCLIQAGLLLVSLTLLMWMSPLLAMEDPTRPPTAKATSSYVPVKKRQGPRWVLNSTLISSDRRTAVINDRVVAVGDRVNGATVVSIQPSAVRLRDKGREVTLVMLKKNIKSLSRVALSSQGN
jgi:MSHA biogenesis protein MshK